MNKKLNKKINNSKKFLSEIKLTKIQKKEMLSKIYNDSGYIPSLYISPYAKFLKQKVLVPVFLIFFLLSGTTYAAASNSLPGNILYPIKTQLIEPLKLATIFNPELKRDYKLSLIDLRISEIKILESNNKLTEEKANENQRQIKRNLELLNSIELDEQKALDLKLKIEAYNEILQDFKHIQLPLESVRQKFESSADGEIELDLGFGNSNSKLETEIREDSAQIKIDLENLKKDISEIQNDKLKDLQEDILNIQSLESQIEKSSESTQSTEINSKIQEQIESLKDKINLL